MHALAGKGQGRSKRVAQAEIITVNESNRFLPLRDDEQSVFVCVFYFLCLNPEPCGQQIHSNWISKLSVPGIQHTCTLSCLRESESWNSNSLLFQKSRGILKTFRQIGAKVAGGGGGRQKKNSWSGRSAEWTEMVESGKKSMYAGELTETRAYIYKYRHTAELGLSFIVFMLPSVTINARRSALSKGSQKLSDEACLQHAQEVFSKNTQAAASAMTTTKKMKAVSSENSDGLNTHKTLWTFKRVAVSNCAT